MTVLVGRRHELMHRGAGQDAARRVTPRQLAAQVLARCKHELALPSDLTLDWDDRMQFWEGEYDPRRQRITLPGCLLEQPDRAAALVYGVGHEACHASIKAAAAAGRLPVRYLLEEDLAERLAVEYGKRTVAAWEWLTGSCKGV